jgi:predicted amidohydrolase
VNEVASLAAAQLEARPGRPSEAVEAHVRCARAAARLGAEVVIFPELSLTGYSRWLARDDALHSTDSRLEPLAEISRKLGITLVVGAPIVGIDRLMIASFCFRPDGRVLTYTKRLLHDGEERTFEAGHGGALLDVNGTQVGLAICAEINHASHVGAAVADGAAVYAASCFLTAGGYLAGCGALQGYAASHGVVVVMANYTGACCGFESAGGSAIWDDRGAVAVRAPTEGEHLVMAVRDNGPWVGHCVPLDDALNLPPAAGSKPATTRRADR